MGKSLKTSQRTIAAVSIASLALLNVGIMAPAAHAEGDGSNPTTTDVPATPAPGKDFTEPASPSTIRDTAKLKITKKTPDSKTANSAPNGTEATGEAVPSGKAVDGAQFTLYLVEGVDLSTNAGWREANRLVDLWKKETNKEGAETLDGHTISGPKATVKTANGGIAETEKMPHGLYIVRETIPEAGVTVDGKTYKESAVLKAEPFIVALPMTNQNNPSEWLEVVNVYPKNTVTALEKSVKDAQTPGTNNTEEGANSNIVYTITSEIPKNKTLEAYDLVDPLDSRLKYVSSALKITSADGPDVELTESTEGAPGDYAITHKISEADNPASTEDGDTLETDKGDKVKDWVTVEFTKQGLAKINENGGGKVQWDLTANVEGTEGASSIENKAYLIPDSDGSAKWREKDKPTTPPGTPSTKVVSKYGKVTIQKTDEEGGALGGAKFELYTCAANAEIKPENKVTVGNQSEWTSKEAEGDDKGKIIIDGLQLNDFKNGARGKTLGEADANGQAYAGWEDKSFYCLVETKAPNDYELLPNPIQFQLTQNDTNWSKSLTIENVPNNSGFNLPLTGGKGIFGLIALGALLVLGSIGYIFFASRRQES